MTEMQGVSRIQLKRIRKVLIKFGKHQGSARLCVYTNIPDHIKHAYPNAVFVELKQLKNDSDKIIKEINIMVMYGAMDFRKSI